MDDDGIIRVQVEPGSPTAIALQRLQDAFAGFPWCKCEVGHLSDDLVYFENQHGVSHGWACRSCNGVVQVG